MRSILAIAGIAIRNAIRSRVVVCLFAILALVIFGLPLVVKGDGTMEGQVRVMLNYTLGLAGMILSLTALWAGCAAISSELAEKQIHLVVTKPVSRLQVWFGKWLGLMAIITVLLACCGGATYGLLTWKMSSGTFTAEEQARLRRDVLTARHVVRPAPIDVEAQARQLLEKLRGRGAMPAGVSEARVLQTYRKDLTIKASTLAKGQSRRWDFTVPAGSAEKSGVVQYRVSTSRMGTLPAVGAWQAGPPEGSPVFRQVVTNPPGSTMTITLPAGVADAAGRVAVDYVNTETGGVSVVFLPADEPVLLIPADRFEWNFARVLIVVLARLAFIAAVGVTAGALFSMPVAGFLSLCFVLLLQLSTYIASAAQEEIIVPWHTSRGHGPDISDALFRALFRGIHAVIAPLEDRDALGAMAAGHLVSWLWVGQVLLIQVVVYGGALALIGTAIFNRREAGLTE
ncbi:MAG: ABC transporter permease [bacterium]